MRNFVTAIFALFMAINVMAQPQAFKYQTVVRDSEGEIVANQTVSFQMKILQGSPAGTEVYAETHTATTNQFGLANLEIGNGTLVSGNFETIDWGSGDYFIEISFDINGGTNYLLAGTSQLMAVPYALYAKESGSGSAWQAIGNDIYYNNGKVGIGTATPTRLLHLYGGDALIETPEWSDLTIRTTTAGTDASLLLRTATDGVWANDNYWAVYNDVSEDNKFTIQYKDQRKMTILNNGNLGIGTINPGSKLEVVDQTRFAVDVSHPGVLKFGNIYSSYDTLRMASLGNVEVSIDDNNTSTGSSFRIVNNCSSHEILRVQDNGRLGIGTTNPEYRLHVKNGDAMVEDTSWCDFKIKATNEGKDPALQLYAGDDYWSLNHDDSEANDLDIRFNNTTKISVETDGRVGIGTGQPDPSALLQVYSTNKGFLSPRMSSTQIAAIPNPANGLMVYNTSDGHPYIFNTSDYKWKRVAFDATTITPDCGTQLVDTRDGQVYNTVKIGTQCWMAENLNIGTRINETSTNNGTIEKYCFSNSDAMCDIYGGLYQWDEMMNYNTTPGIQGICPTGWHVPTDAEWISLTDYVSSQTAYHCNSNNTYIAKSLASTTNWNTSDWPCAIGNSLASNNETGFSALPGGYRTSGGIFSSGGYTGYLGQYWSSSKSDASSAWNWHMGYGMPHIVQDDNSIWYGFSLRCLKDN